MPTYLCHGFRWQRRSIRVYTVVQDLDDVSPEWLIRPTTSRCLLQSFYNLFEFLPYCTPPPPGRGGYLESGSWDSEEEDEEDEQGGSDEENGEGVGGVLGGRGNGEERNERSKWPERLESLGMLRGGSEEKGKGKVKSVEGKGEDASSAITAIHVGGNESTSRTTSRSPSLKLPLQGSRTSSKTRRTAAAATPTTATTTSAPPSRSPSTLGVSSSGRQKSKKNGSRSASRDHSPNSKKDELSAQRWSAVKVLEEYDPNNLDEVSRPYAYVADHVVRVDGAVDILAEVRRYEERMQQRQRQKREEEVEEVVSGARKGVEKRNDKKKGGRDNKANRDSGGSGGSGGRGDEEYHDALEHLEENAKEREQTWIEQLRDELQRGEEMKWYVVVNGDEERNYSNSNDFDEEDDEDEYDEEELSSSEINYGTYHHDTSEDLSASELLSNHPSLAAHPPTDGGRPSLLSHSGSGSRTSSRGGQSKSRSQSRSHSRTRTRHRNHSRPRHGNRNRRRPKPTKEQRQHHAQYTLQQELFERNDLRASSSATTTPTTTVAANTRGTTTTTTTGPPPTAMRNMNTKAIIKEGAARRVMSEGGIHPALRGGPKSPEIPIIMVTPTRMTFPTGTAGASGKRVVEQQQQQQQQQRVYDTGSNAASGSGSGMGIVSSAAAATSSFSLETSPSNVPASSPAPNPNPNPTTTGHSTSKRSSLTARTPSWSCLNLVHGHHSTSSSGDKDTTEANPPPRPSFSPPIPLHPGGPCYEPVSTLPPRPAPPPPASAAQRPGRPLTPPPPLGQAESNRVPTAPSSPVAIKISATPAEFPEAQAAAPPVVGQYSSKTMPTRKGNNGYGSRSRSSGSLRRLFQRTSGKEGWI